MSLSSSCILCYPIKFSISSVYAFSLYIPLPHISYFPNLANQHQQLHSPATPRIATLTRNRHKCLTMVLNLACTISIQTVLVVTSRKFSTQIFIMLPKIWISLVSQRPTCLLSRKFKNLAITTLRSYERRQLLLDLIQGALQCLSVIILPPMPLCVTGRTRVALLYAYKGRS